MSEESNPTEEATEASQGKVGLTFLTLFILVLVAGLVVMALLGHRGEVGEKLADADLYINTLGNMHPLVLHLPIGIVFLTLVMEALGWISFGRYRPVTTVGLFFAIITGTLACVTGYVDMVADGYASIKGDVWTIADPWGDHMWAGIAFVGVLSLAFLSRVWNPEKGGQNPIYAILLFGAAGVMGFGAHIGGEKVHGATGVEKIVQELTGSGEAVADGEEVTDDAPMVFKEPKNRLAYADVIVPILESRCLACHAEDTKKKGGLLMDSWGNLLAGGGSAPEIMTFVPGDVKMSYMVEVLHLDEDDDMFMPPPSKKREPMPDSERAIIKWWVGALAKSDQLEDKTLAEMEAPAEIIEAASKLVSPEELAAIAAEKEAVENAVAEAKKKEREALDSALGALKQDEQLKNAINYVSQDSSELEFTAVSLRKNMTDEQFVKLVPVASSLSALRLGATSVSEDALIENLPQMKNLRQLNLSQTAVTDAALDAVAQLDKLEWLNLYDTAVTDAGIAKLKGLIKLEKLYLWNSKATPDGAAALKKELPNLEVIFGAN